MSSLLVQDYSYFVYFLYLRPFLDLQHAGTLFILSFLLVVASFGSVGVAGFVSLDLVLFIFLAGSASGSSSKSGVT